MNTSSLNHVYSRGIRKDSSEFLRSYYSEEFQRKQQQRKADERRLQRERYEETQDRIRLQQERADRARASDRREQAVQQRDKIQDEQDQARWTNSLLGKSIISRISSLRADTVFLLLSRYDL